MAHLSFSSGSTVQSVGSCPHRQDSPNQLESAHARQLLVVQVEDHRPLRSGNEPHGEHRRQLIGLQSEGVDAGSDVPGAGLHCVRWQGVGRVHEQELYDEYVLYCSGGGGNH